MEKEGDLITFEGGEGSGKTVLVEWLAQRLQGRIEREVVVSCEPGGTVIGDHVRSILLDRRHTEMVPIAEALLFLAARRQLYSEVVLPNLAAGKIVLLDRSGDSTLAYQGYGHGLDLSLLRMLNTIVTGGSVPELTVLCDCSVEVGRSRKREDWNRLDASTTEFLERVRWGYVALAQDEPERWFVVDAEQRIALVKKAVWERVVTLLEIEEEGATCASYQTKIS